VVPEAVREYLESHRQEHVAALQELLRIPSIANVHDEPDACLRAAAWLVERLQGLGLEAEIVDVPDGRPNVLAGYRAGADRPTVLIYGHYDVQPPDPLEPWTSPPFAPAVRDGRLYARGANDDKGQLFCHLMAIEAWQRAGGGLPVNLIVLIEGEEEIGSPRLEPWVAAHADRLRADAVVISDSEFFAPGVPSLTCGLRGLTYVQLTLRGAASDVHSGLHGGALRNPANALAALLAGLHDPRGRVTLEGFYDAIRPPADSERQAWAALPFDEAAYARSLGLAPEALTGGEAGLGVLERRWARPTLDCNGLVAGYTGQGAKTIIPAEATAKISMRLVPDQDPQQVVAALRDYVRQNTPPGLTASVDVHATARPVLLRHDSPAMRAGRRALEAAFGAEAALIRCGASVPVTELFQRLLDVDPVLMGFGLPDDNLHAPNEKFDLGQLYGGAAASAAFLTLLPDELAAG